MNTFLSKIAQAFKGDKGELSSKRVVGITGAAILYIAIFVDIDPPSELIQAVEWITILCLGFTSIEKFSK